MGESVDIDGVNANDLRLAPSAPTERARVTMAFVFVEAFAAVANEMHEIIFCERRKINDHQWDPRTALPHCDDGQIRHARGEVVL